MRAGIERLIQLSDGGFGGLMFRAHYWAYREQTWRSYELFARYVMPRFQNQLSMQTASYEWAKANRKTVFSTNVDALRKAYTDAGVKPPEEFANRALGARDIDGTGQR